MNLLLGSLEMISRIFFSDVFAMFYLEWFQQGTGAPVLRLLSKTINVPFYYLYKLPIFT